MAGFLSTEDSNAPGNNALLDLVAALHWVKENIAAFGGDPDQVTLMGQGHGAALVNILMISPISKGKTSCCVAGSTILPVLSASAKELTRFFTENPVDFLYVYCGSYILTVHDAAP